MKKYVAFLRAINVGGTKIIKMDDLKKTFASFGFENVQTYIQSGNVIFETNKSTALESKIEKRLEKALGYKVETFVRSMDEVADIANKSPFTPQGEETLHVVFLRRKPVKSSVEALTRYNSAADQFAAPGREVYNLRRDRERSVFSNGFIEKIFGAATTRNMTTVKKILEKYR